MVRVKTFLLALQTMNSNPKKAKSYLKDKRLSQSEKKILECFFMVRDNQLTEAKSILDSLSTNDHVVESQRQLLLGICWNNLSHFDLGIKSLEESLKLMPAELEQNRFIACHNLFTVYFNLQELGGMKFWLDKMSSFPESTSSLRCRFNYECSAGNFEAATQSMNLLDSKKSTMPEAMLTSYLLNVFDFYIKQEKWSKASAVLEEMKNQRKFTLSANYNFMKKLLEHRVEKKPLYIMDSDFAEFPLLLHQIRVIHALEGRDIDQATVHWNKLKTLYPKNYGAPFKFLGLPCLFSKCLELYQKLPEENQLKAMPLPEHKSDALLQILKEAQGPVNQALIYELLWQETPEDKSSLNKLSQMVRLLNKKGHNIKMKKSCYYFEGQITKKSKVS